MHCRHVTDHSVPSSRGVHVLGTADRLAYKPPVCLKKSRQLQLLAGMLSLAVLPLRTLVSPYNRLQTSRGADISHKRQDHNLHPLPH